MKLELSYPLGENTFVSQPFGVNWGADYKAILGLDGHPGEDLTILRNGINVSFGLAVRAACPGIILAIEKDGRGGHTVVQLSDGPYDYEGGKTHFKLIYAHCLKDSIKVIEGQAVNRGDVLALCGSSGVTSDGIEHAEKAHVHFGLKPTYFKDDVKPPYWANTYQDNGFGGAIDSSGYWVKKLPESPVAPEPETPPMPELENIKEQVSILQKIVDLISKVVQSLFKK
jgi:murein DD-endopeptidase MepM/ murein hydrolase activator NlpD